MSPFRTRRHLGNSKSRRRAVAAGSPGRRRSRSREARPRRTLPGGAKAGCIPPLHQRPASSEPALTGFGSKPTVQGELESLDLSALRDVEHDAAESLIARWEA